MRWYTWLVLILAGPLCVFAGLYATQDSSRPDDGRAGREPTTTTIQGIGYVEPVSEVRRLTPRTGGVIRQCLVKAGDRAYKGDRLLELENATLKAEVAVARKNLEMVRAEATHVNAGINPHQIKATEQTLERLREKLAHCQSEAARSQRLVASKSASTEEHQAIQTRYRQIQVEVREKEAELLYLKHYVTPENKSLLEAKGQHAQAALELAEERLRETVLLAPFDGFVLKVLKREGEGVGVGVYGPEAVLLFGDTSRMRVRAEIDERFVAMLAVGQDATVYGRNLGGKSYPGKVVLVEPVMGGKTVFSRSSSERKDLDVLQVVVELDTAFRAPAGLQVDVKIEVPSIAE